MLRYPGAYIDEPASGVTPIQGVPTSIAAFLGRASRGPVSEPVSIHSLTEFSRTFGDVKPDYPLGYAVEDFFLNGGSKALIVRLYRAARTEQGKATITFDLPAASPDGATPLVLTAVSPGSWANSIRAEVDRDFDAGAEDESLFNVTLISLNPDGSESDRERIPGVSVTNTRRRIDEVLERESRWFRIPDPPVDGETGDLKASPPAGTTAQMATGGLDSTPLTEDDYIGDPDSKTGMYALNKAEIFNLLCIPPDTLNGDVPAAVLQAALRFCVAGRAMLIVDPPAAMSASFDIAAVRSGIGALGLTGTDTRNAAIYYPRIRRVVSKPEDRVGTCVPCGAIAGVITRTDQQRGIWKSPAGREAVLKGIAGTSIRLNDRENGLLNESNINCLRSLAALGDVVWGARTLWGTDPYKYIAVRRLALFIEESLYRGSQWVVFEENDERLWRRIRLSFGAFLHDLFRQAAFAGRSPDEAYFIKCGNDTTTQNDIELGLVNAIVGFAPLTPAEFVIIKLQHKTGQIQP